ncbi:hypothetical protein G6F60_015125 [Rhizopus arrhizus]|nr:hypothetical protein G6F60_015125 [Rhizopus arrhizus]
MAWCRCANWAEVRHDRHAGRFAGPEPRRPVLLDAAGLHGAAVRGDRCRHGPGRLRPGRWYPAAIGA